MSIGANITKQTASRKKQRVVYIYIDNSNLWIQGQKTSAQAKGLETILDPLWRFDAGRLRHVLTRAFTSKTYKRNFEVKYEVTLYGSTPPPVDTIWTAISSKDVNVKVFPRSKWTGHEKQVDAQLGADATEQAIDNYHGRIDSEFVIVSGDLDLLPAVKKIAGRGFPVHIWSWRNCFASEYRYQKDELIQVHELDDHLDEVGFCEDFRPERQREDIRANERKPPKRCVWGRYCQRVPHCNYSHPKDEEAAIEKYGKRTATKYKMCNAQNSCTRIGCSFAHGTRELLCPTCDQIGAGHQMGECIER